MRMTGLHFSKHAVAATRQGLNSDDKPMKGAGKKEGGFVQQPQIHFRCK
jgi:hypothetical protein